jgi:hypothetical protein
MLTRRALLQTTLAAMCAPPLEFLTSKVPATKIPSWLICDERGRLIDPSGRQWIRFGVGTRRAKWLVIAQ